MKLDSRVAKRSFRDGEVIVKFKSGSRVAMKAPQRAKFRTSKVSAVDKLFSEIGVTEVEELMPLTGANSFRSFAKGINGKTVVAAPMEKAYLLRFDAKSKSAVSVGEAVAKLKASGEVEFAEPNYIVYSLAEGSEPDDPYYSLQYGIEAINLNELMKEPVISKEGPVIAILDTGVDTNHPDLKDNIWVNPKEANGIGTYDDDGNGFTDDVVGWDFVNQTGNVIDYNGHGTHCAGIAAASGFNGIGIVGANPDAKIMPLTVLQSNGQGDISTIIKAVDYATANGADILSMSLGTYAESIALEQALGRAYQNAVLVAAAGNDGLCLNHGHPEKGQLFPMTMFPAAYTFVIGVQASSQSGGLAGFSNYDDDGPSYSPYSEEKLYNYEVTVPGVSIMSTFPNGQYKQLNGTSMATPLVAGALSRLMQAKEISNKEDFFGDLINSSTSVGNLDIYAAFRKTDADRRPELQFVTYEIADSIGGDGDSRADAGETIEIYPVIRNSWGKAGNIRISIESAELVNNVCEFVTPTAEFGSVLSSYGKAKSANLLKVKFNDDVVDGRTVMLKLCATCDNAEPVEQEIQLTVENGIEIGGLLKEDMTLSAGKHYIVTSLLGVPEGRTLTIEPGTVLKFKDGTGISVSGKVIANGEPGNMITFTKADLGSGNITRMSFGENSLSYCNFNNLNFIDNKDNLYSVQAKCFSNCVYNDLAASYIFDNAIYYKGNFLNLCAYTGPMTENTIGILDNCNVIGGNNLGIIEKCFLQGNKALNSNFFSNYFKSGYYSLGYYSETAQLFTPEKPNYLGTGRRDIAQTRVLDINNPNSTSFGEYDLSNMLVRPSAEAHGIVWKVVVDGYDAQDEFEQLPPLGVGKHKFEVYFNRPMNKTVAPSISMGVRPPYTQTAISEDGAWNEAGDIYTAYLTISGKQSIDGLNRIYVYGAQDDEYFDIPVENMRFNVSVQAAGSLSEGFTAEAGLGKVQLTWENTEDNFDDMLGYNLYRYSIGSNNQPSDTTRINTYLLEPQETEFTDYEVTPGTTYCYFYKVMRTSMLELDPSKTVAVTPLTSVKGDANGSASVDVADVVTTVNYASGMSPKPFIFEAADINEDTAIDILDVVGIIRVILNPEQKASIASLASATVSIEDGVVYVESPIALAGVQLNLQLPKDAKVSGASTLDGFEQTGAWISDDEYIFLAYNLGGKTIPAGRNAILNIGDAKIKSIKLSDADGRNVEAVFEDLGSVATPKVEVDVAPGLRGIYNMYGVKLSDDTLDFDTLPSGVYIVNGKKVVK